MLPYNSQTQVRAWTEERLATAAHLRRVAEEARYDDQPRGWRKLVAWLTARH